MKNGRNALMNNYRRDIQVSVEEMECLKKVSSHDQRLLGLFTPEVTKHTQRSITIRLDRDSSEKLRELLTERLAKVGFDRDYRPNATGRMLEDLIDRLFQPR